MIQDKVKIKDKKYMYLSFSYGNNLGFKSGDNILITIKEIDGVMKNVDIPVTIRANRKKLYLPLGYHAKTLKLKGEEIVGYDILKLIKFKEVLNGKHNSTEPESN